MTIDKVLETIEAHRLIQKGQHIIVGLSGGPDSVCLFHVLLELSERLDLTLHPLHVNHGIRGEAAQRDQDYVEALCRDRGLTCHSVYVDCPALARELHLSEEEAGRRARYDAFCAAATSVAARLAEPPASDARPAAAGRAAAGNPRKSAQGAGHSLPESADFTASPAAALRAARDRVRIAVAHNADDQAETILQRLLRGTGPDGLAGMPYSREEQGFIVIRPVLDLTRSEIESYCRERGLNPVTDHTNKETIYTRNRIRMELLPYLEREYNANIRDGLLRLGRIAAIDKDYLSERTEAEYARLTHMRRTGDDSARNDAVTMDRAELSQLHKAIRHRVMLRAFNEIGLIQDVSEERIAAADYIIERKQAPKTVEFPHGYRMTVARGSVTFHRGAENKVPKR